MKKILEENLSKLCTLCGGKQRNKNEWKLISVDWNLKKNEDKSENENK